MILPTKVAKAIHDQIPGSIYDPVQGWIIPDTPEVASLPGFQVVLGGVKFEVVMKDIMRERVYGKRGYVYSGIGSNDNIVSVFYLHARIFVEHKCSILISSNDVSAVNDSLCGFLEMYSSSKTT